MSPLLYRQPLPPFLCLQNNFFSIIVGFISLQSDSAPQDKTLKHILAILIALVIPLAAAQCVGFELSVDYANLYEDKATLKASRSTDATFFPFDGSAYSITAPIGLSATASAYFGSPFNAFELGMSLRATGNRFSEIKLAGSKYTGFTGNSLGFSFGPALRVNMGRFASLYVNPAAQLNIKTLKFDEDSSRSFSGTLEERTLAFDCTAGGRLWFHRTDKSQLGLDAGIDFTYPLNSSNNFDVKASGIKLDGLKYKITKAHSLKFYVGLCLSLGKHGVE